MDKEKRAAYNKSYYQSKKDVKDLQKQVAECSSPEEEGRIIRDWLFNVRGIKAKEKLIVVGRNGTRQFRGEQNDETN